MNADPRRELDQDWQAWDFRMLGEVEVRRGDQPIALGPSKARLALAILLAAEGTPISSERLISQLWSDGDTPPTASDLMYGYVSKLRSAIDKAAAGAADHFLPKRASIYQLKVVPVQVDLHRFTQLRKRAFAAMSDNPERAASLFREALQEWGNSSGLRGSEPLTGLTGQWASGYRQTLMKQRREALLACLNSELSLGHDHQLVSELEEFAKIEPNSEELAWLRMLALYRSGHASEAIGVYLETCKLLANTIGFDPGQKLAHLYERIVKQDPALMVHDKKDGAPMGTHRDQITSGASEGRTASGVSTEPREAAAPPLPEQSANRTGHDTQAGESVNASHGEPHGQDEELSDSRSTRLQQETAPATTITIGDVTNQGGVMVTNSPVTGTVIGTQNASPRDT